MDFWEGDGARYPRVGRVDSSTCGGEKEIGRPRTNSREEEEDAQMFPCGKAVESRTHIVGGCEICKEERNVLQEMRKIDRMCRGDI